MGQFKRFLEQNSDYAQHRDGLNDVRNLADTGVECDDFPASVTWYDALAYASWRRKKRKATIKAT